MHLRTILNIRGPYKVGVRDITDDMASILDMVTAQVRFRAEH